MTYPTKVQSVLNAIDAANHKHVEDGFPTFVWFNVEVVERDLGGGSTQYVIRAARPGNVFVSQTLQVFVSVRKGRTIEGTDIYIKAGSSFRGGTIYRFGGDLKIKPGNIRALYLSL